MGNSSDINVYHGDSTYVHYFDTSLAMFGHDAIPDLQKLFRNRIFPLDTAVNKICLCASITLVTHHLVGMRSIIVICGLSEFTIFFNIIS